MGKFQNPRDLKPAERELLEFLLTADFPGRDELKQQLDCVEVIGDCDCGCGTINLTVENPVVHSTAREPIPIEAHGKGLEVLLFVRNGLLSSLEIVDYGDHRPIPYPSPNSLELWVPPSKHAL
jgi:hypothetical protein